MAERHHPPHQPTAGRPGEPVGDPEASARAFHDGRFGKTFDAEIDVKAVFWVAIAIFAFTIVGMAIAWGIYQAGLPQEDEAQRLVGTPDDLVAPSRLPAGPLLQMHPEEELTALRLEMRRDLETWRWDDQSAGTVVLPIDVALERVAAQGLPARPAPPAAAALAAEPAETRSPQLQPVAATPGTDAAAGVSATSDPAASDPAASDRAAGGPAAGGPAAGDAAAAEPPTGDAAVDDPAAVGTGDEERGGDDGR